MRQPYSQSDLQYQSGTLHRNDSCPLTNRDHQALQRTEATASLRKHFRKGIESEEAAQHTLVVSEHGELKESDR